MLRLRSNVEELNVAVPALDDLARDASAEAVELARTVLEQDASDHAWTRQLGPAMSQRDVARLLGRSEQAVSKDPRLLRLRNRDGRPVYPFLQFRGRALLPGIAEVVGVLTGVVEPLTVASWLTAPNRALGRARPVDALRDERIDEVLAVAGRFAARAAV